MRPSVAELKYQRSHQSLSAQDTEADSRAEAFAIAYAQAVKAARKVAAAVALMEAARVHLIRLRYDPTIPLTPETRFCYRRSRRVLVEQVARHGEL